MLDSVTDLRSLLQDPSLLPNKAYIAGEWVDAADGKTFPVTNPARGDVIANVADMTREDARRAIRLVGLVNDVSLRNLIPDELAKGFGFVQSKPASAFSPVFVTPDELGAAWCFTGSG